MSTRRRLLVAVVALVAMIVPLAASAAPPAGEPGDPELLAALPGGAGSGSADRSGRRAVRAPAGNRRDLARRSEERRPDARIASGLPRRFSAAPVRRRHGRRVHRLDRVRPRQRRRIRVSGRPVRLSPANRRDLPRERAYELDRRRRHRHVCVRQPAVRVPVRRPDRSPVRAGDVSRRIPRHRRTPQPRASRHAGRRDHATDRVRRRRPDRAGHLREHDLPRRSRPCSA